jgi:hypothetical protein
MAQKDLLPPELEPSTQILIAEHQRLSELYIYNSEMGEKRTTTYLSVISLIAAGMIGLTQFVDTHLLFWPSLGLIAGMLILGMLTFQRLIERRIRCVENLRAINRIHRYFVDKDPALANFFYWPACDDVPSFRSKGAAFAGLRDILAFLNSLFLGFLAGALLANTEWNPPMLVDLLVGCVTAVVSWVLHQAFEGKMLDRAETDALVEDVRFPLSPPGEPSSLPGGE